MSDSYPALIELISRLEGKDKKTCELALYCLNKADKREAKLREERDAARMEVIDVVRENEKLRAAVTEERERCAWIADKFEGWSGSFVARAIRDADFEERWEGYGWR